MTGFSEASTIQAALIEWSEDAGWTHVPGKHLPRLPEMTDVAIAEWMRQALVRLNPNLAEGPDAAENIEIVLAEVQRAIIDVDEGLVAANKRVTSMLRGEHSFKMIDGKEAPRRFIDFDDIASNLLVVADEVSVHGGDNNRRCDIVWYVNGFPLVVCETKSPVKNAISWVAAAEDLHNVYEVEYPHFFTPVVFEIATDGIELRMAPPDTPADPDNPAWAPWGSTTDDPKEMVGPKRVERAGRLLVKPQVVLDLLHDFSLVREARDSSERDQKILPRYPQYEAVLAIHRKVLDNKRTGKGGGLIWHHQGSGKTELCAFAAARLLHDPATDNPTVIVLVDRKDLDRQTGELFRSTGLKRVESATSKGGLQRAVRTHRGVVISTVHKFADAGLLTDRKNIVVLVDEAHRSQEGSLGRSWRQAVPNAMFFGMTGTAVEEKDRSSFRLFGDPDDPSFVLSRYTMEASIADGFTKSVIVEPRKVGFDLDKETLDDAFDELAKDEDLDEETKVFLSSKASHAETILSNPDRIAKVCADIADHYLSVVEPSGQKAQVVAYNQRLVVAYATALEAELKKRGSPRTVAVVMHVTDSKQTPAELRKYTMTPEQEEATKRRFKDFRDPLSFVVVTAKWMTGFNAPIEGVLYLDKPLKGVSLFQTITRPNRPWRNPATGQPKEFGRVVDYIGLAVQIGKALIGPKPDGEGGAIEVPVADIDTLVGKFGADLNATKRIFAGIDMRDASLGSLGEAYELVHEGAPKHNEFISRFVALEAVWEFLASNAEDHPLAPHRLDYYWSAKVFEAIQPKITSTALTWQRLGPKTLNLIHSNISNVAVAPGRAVTLDAKGMALIKKIAEQLSLPGLNPPDLAEGDVVKSVLDSIETRLQARVAGTNPAVYKSLAERVERLRQRAISSVAESMQFLEEAMQIAADVVSADRAAAEGSLTEDPEEARLFDPKIGALTQIVEENAPPGLHQIVPDIAQHIDQIVREVAYTGWAENSNGDKAVRREIRAALKHYGLPVSGTLFDKTYDYVRQNY